MATKRPISNPLALAVLALLRQRPSHPYEMAALMRQRHWHDGIKLNYGSLYTVVDALQREGLIVPRETVREGRRPERTVYALTEAGEAELLDWLRDLLGRPAKEYTQLAAGLTLIANLPREEATALLAARADRLEADVARQRAELASLTDAVPDRPTLPRLFFLEGEYELAQREAELAWLRRTIQEIEEGSLRWPDFGRRAGPCPVPDAGGEGDAAGTATMEADA